MTPQAIADTKRSPCSEYDAWLLNWRGRNEERFDPQGQIWGRVQNAAMARYLGVRDRYEELCSEGSHVMATLFAPDGSLVRVECVCHMFGPLHASCQAPLSEAVFACADGPACTKCQGFHGPCLSSRHVCKRGMVHACCWHRCFARGPSEQKGGVADCMLTSHALPVTKQDVIS
jgi:hypothetical protein